MPSPQTCAFLSVCWPFLQGHILRGSCHYRSTVLLWSENSGSAFAGQVGCGVVANMIESSSCKYQGSVDFSCATHSPAILRYVVLVKAVLSYKKQLTHHPG